MKKSFFGDRRFLGSTLVLGFGIIAIVVAATDGIDGTATEGAAKLDTAAGWVMVLGALTYRSAKKRKLGLAKPSMLRRIGEIIALVLIGGLFVAAGITGRTVEDPFSNLVLPLWAVIAYAAVIFKKPSAELASSTATS